MQKPTYTGLPFAAPFGKPAIFKIEAFATPPVSYPLLRAGPGVVWASFDFGDGTVETVSTASYTPGDTLEHTYASPGSYVLRVEVAVGTPRPLAPLNTSGSERVFANWQKFSWPVQVVLPVGSLSPESTTLDFTASVHGTLSLERGTRHAILPVPQLSSFDSYGSSQGSSGGSSGDGPFSGFGGTGPFMRALSAFARLIQQDFAFGFGRIPVPSACIERLMQVQCTGESLLLGTSTGLQSDLTILEEHFRQAMAGACGDRSSALAAVASDVNAINTLYTDLNSLQRANLTGGDILIAGDRSIQAAEVQQWYEYKTSAVADEQLLLDMTVGEQRRYEGAYERSLPSPDMSAVWQWSTVQQVLTAIGSFYGVYLNMADGYDLNTAQILITAVPGGQSVSVRITDNIHRFWVQVLVALGGEGDSITYADLANDGERFKGRVGTHALCRVVGVINNDTTATELPAVYDVARVEAALDPQAFLKAPSLNSIDQLTQGLIEEGKVTPLDSFVGPATLKFITSTGTEVQMTASSFGSSSDAGQQSIGAVAVAPRAVKLPQTSDEWASMTPHAVWALHASKSDELSPTGVDAARASSSLAAVLYGMAGNQIPSLGLLLSMTRG